MRSNTGKDVEGEVVVVSVYMCKGTMGYGMDGSMDDQSKKIQDGNKTEKEKEKREQNGNHVVVELELLEVGILRGGWVM